MNPKRDIFDWAYLTGLGCFFLVILTVVVIAMLDGLLGLENPVIANVVAMVIVLTGLVCVVLLWIEGVGWLFSEWKNRSIEANLGILAFLVIGPVFAAFVLHFLKKRETFRPKEIERRV
jgi:magnesium-transporting ATPase (P-type)